MNVNAWLRMIAGFFVMLSVALGYAVSPYFFFFTKSHSITTNAGTHCPNCAQ